MTKQDIKKSIKLSLEFDDYLARHPEAYDKIPKGAVVVVTSGTDPKLRETSIDWVKHYPKQQTLVEARKYASRWVLKPLTLSRA